MNIPAVCGPFYWAEREERWCSTPRDASKVNTYDRHNKSIWLSKFIIVIDGQYIAMFGRNRDDACDRAREYLRIPKPIFMNVIDDWSVR